MTELNKTNPNNEALSPAQAQAALASLNEKTQTGWQLDNTVIQKTYTFANFRAAFAFMTECALWSEKMNHHPEWSNTYKTVAIRLTSHDVNALSMRDFLLAEKFDIAAARQQPKK